MQTQLDDVLTSLYALAKRGSRQDLSGMREACAREKNPQDEVVSVHVAGTNGKGSVVAMVESIARAAGLRTGLYTSPHLVRFSERIRLDGHPVDDAVLTSVLARVMDEHPELTFFEVTTLAAFSIFREARVDLAILEVGLGGRLDATNVVSRPLATAVTSIAYDHVEILGDSIERIAAEKAGILKANVPVVTGPLPLAAQQVVRTRAKEVGAGPVWTVGEHLVHEILTPEPQRADDEDLSRLIVRGPSGRSVAAQQSLAGVHQRDNMAVAIGLAWQMRAGGPRSPALPIEDLAIVRGIAQVSWPGRLESIEGKGTWAGRWLLDGAHNEEGARALAAEIRRHPVPREARALVFGAMGDKAWGSMARELAPHFATRVYVEPRLGGPPRPTAAPTALLAIDPRGVGSSSLEEGLRLARASVGPQGLVVVSGSLYLVGDVRARLLGDRLDGAVGM